MKYSNMLAYKVCTSAALVTAMFIAASTSAQWTITNLSSTSQSVTTGVGGLQQVGTYASSTNPLSHACMWSGSAASMVDLTPSGGTVAWANATNGTQQFGSVTFDPYNSPTRRDRASLWNGTAASWVDLSPPNSLFSSSVLGAFGGQQVGYSAVLSNNQHATLWTGTAASWVDLNPAGASNSAAYATNGVMQGGAARYGSTNHAVLWNSTAASVIDLHPTGSSGSQVNGMSGSLQAGFANADGLSHASLWSGSAASLVDLNPAGAHTSTATAIFGTYEVGSTVFTFNGPSHASLWNGSAESWEDLSLALPDGVWKATFATGIWSDGSTLYISGYGQRVATPTKNEALLWTQTIPAPASSTLLGIAALIVTRRRR